MRYQLHYSISIVFLLLGAPVLPIIQLAAAQTVQVAAVDAEAEIAAALYAASATQAAAQRVADVAIRNLRDEIERLRLDEALASDEALDVRARLESELAAKEREYVTRLAAKDREYAQEIAVFRNAVEDIASTPEGLRALALFNDGDELGAIAILDDLRAARDEAREAAARIRSAAEARRIAQLALEARNKGKLTTADLIARYEEITALDPGVHWDWVELRRLYFDIGDLPGAERAATGAMETAPDARARSVAFNEIGDVRVAQGDLPGALESYGAGLDIRERLAEADPGNAGWQRDLIVSYFKLARLHEAQKNSEEAITAYRRALAINVRLTALDGTNRQWKSDGDLLRAQLQRLGAPL